MADQLASSPRRRRRSRPEVAGRIRDAARLLFAERGYAATTTKEIARVADVSETLLFRYHGGKAALFDEVITAPLNALMEDFVAHHSDASADATRAEDAARFVTRVYRLLDENRDLLSALTIGRGKNSDGESRAETAGLQGYFEQSVAQLEMQYAARGSAPGFDLGIGVRLGFGLLVSAALLRDWLFPEGPPPQPVIAEALEQMIARALSPLPTIDAAASRQL
jgi:AcrR family transcriptional regulator